MIRTVFAIMIAMLVPACAQPPSDADTSIVQQYIDTDSGTTIEMRVPNTQIGIAERIWVTDTCTWTEGEPRQFTERDWSSTEWTLIETTTEPVRILGDQYSLVRRSLIEPFLPGEYVIPPALVQLGDINSQIATEPIQTTVLGVLTDEGFGELNTIADYTLTAEEQAAETDLIWAGFILGAVLIAIVVLFMMRSHKHRPERSVFDELAAIRDDGIESADGFERLGRVFDRLDARLQETSEFAEMIRVCNQARFAQSDERTVRMPPNRIAGHALELLGHDGYSSAMEGEA